MGIAAPGFGWSEDLSGYDAVIETFGPKLAMLNTYLAGK